MNIIQTNFKYNGNHTSRSLSQIDRIIVHHSASESAAAEQIHQWHLNRGFAGAGYQFLVRKDGSVYALRPVEWVGAHCTGFNTCSIGVCAEGNFENEIMGETQKQALKELVSYLKSKYNINKVYRHKDLRATACPGKNYPFEEIVNSNVQPIVDEPKTSSLNYEQFTLEYQKAYNNTYGYTLAEDGLRGPATQASMNKVLLKKGSRSSLVKWCQGRLRNHKGYSIGIDGIYGAETERVVKQFQQDNGLTADGIIGKNTISILF